MIVARVIATLFAACSVMSTVHAASYSVSVPTTAPYTRFDNFVAAGDFTDTFNFSLQTSSGGYIRLFPKQDIEGISSNLNTTGVTLTLVNNDTERQYTAVLYPSVYGEVSLQDPAVRQMAGEGFDPNKSLVLSGPFEPGRYSAIVSGDAIGSGGGSYIIQFAMQPVPEAATFALMGMGLLGVGMLSRHRGQRKGQAPVL